MPASIRTRLAIVFTLALAIPGLAGAQATATEGILLMAHGGDPSWNERVTALAAGLDGDARPVEVAFGMASRATLQTGIDRLVERGATAIVAVPLFVSSHSSVITSTEYLLGLRDDMPPALRIFAKMTHGHGAPAGGDGRHEMPAAPPAGHDGHQMPADPDAGTKPVVSPVPVRMTDALNHHPLVADILIDRADAISTDPSSEAVVLVAHGPVGEEENDRWLADMRQLGERMDDETDFASIDYLTVRDDAPEPLRGKAAEALRKVVSARAAEGRRVLIVPLLLSFGGIEEGVRERLEGLEYAMASQGLMPDERLGEWVKQVAQKD